MPRKTLFIIPLQKRDPARLVQEIKKYPDADGFEIWIDQLEEKFQNPSGVEDLFRKLKKVTMARTFVAVCKGRNEGGKFPPNPRKKIDLLLAAIRGGADYMDVIFTCPQDQLERLYDAKARSKVILSFHDFNKTQDSKYLRNIVAQMKDSGADIIKIATFARSPGDSNRLMHLALELKKTPHIIMGMGEKGMITRVFSEEMGNVLTFVTGEKSTAEGQLSLKDMLHLRRVF